MKQQWWWLGLGLMVLLAGCAPPYVVQHEGIALELVAQSKQQWTGVAVAPDGRLFVNYPRWSDNVPLSVAEVLADGSVRPYPSMELNQWQPGDDPATQLVCVQSVVVDEQGFLWILDPANPRFQGVVSGGPKLLKVDLARDRIVQTIRFGPPVIERDSYLNDVRIDHRHQAAYITDSGNGALVVVDLTSGRSRRLLAGHPSTASEGALLTIEGQPWQRGDGTAPQVHADGIALDQEGEFLYYQALTGRSLYGIGTRWLRDSTISAHQLADKVEYLGQSGASDGLLFGPDGRVYISALEDNAVKAYTPWQVGEVETVVRDTQLSWPDSFAQGADGSIYVTTSQIHRGGQVRQPYKIFRFKIDP